MLVTSLGDEVLTPPLDSVLCCLLHLALVLLPSLRLVPPLPGTGASNEERKDSTVRCVTEAVGTSAMKVWHRCHAGYAGSSAAGI